jgi:hypothetical protein
MAVDASCGGCGHAYRAEVVGAHRLLCGDASKSEDVACLMDGQTVSAVVTDPPYGLEREGITNDDPATLGALYREVLRAMPLRDAVVVAFQSPRLVVEWLDAVRAAGHHFERMLWLHRRSAVTFPWHGWTLAGDAIALSSCGSPVWPDPPSYCQDTYVRTALDPEDHLTGSHPTIKPVAVIVDLLSKLPAGPAYEPFMGSGTALVACEQTGRLCYGMEVAPGYCDVTVRRWQRVTGGHLILVRDGEAREVELPSD